MSYNIGDWVAFFEDQEEKDYHGKIISKQTAGEKGVEELVYTIEVNHKGSKVPHKHYVIEELITGIWEDNPLYNKAGLRKSKRRKSKRRKSTKRRKSKRKSNKIRKSTKRRRRRR